MVPRHSWTHWSGRMSGSASTIASTTRARVDGLTELSPAMGCNRVRNLQMVSQAFCVLLQWRSVQRKRGAWQGAPFPYQGTIRAAWQDRSRPSDQVAQLLPYRRRERG